MWIRPVPSWRAHSTRTRHDSHHASSQQQSAPSSPAVGQTDPQSTVPARPSPRMLARERTAFLVSAAPDEKKRSNKMLRSSITAKKIMRNISTERCFTLGEDRPKFGAPLERGANQLAVLDISSQLNLSGHAHKKFANHTPEQLAQLLYDCGLKTVGVIKFQCCDLGKADYLDRLYKELDDRGIRFGYLAAYDGEFGEHRHAFKDQNGKIRVENTHWLGANRTVDGSRNTARHTRVVKGNVDVVFVGTKYNLPWRKSEAPRELPGTEPDGNENADQG